jgi:NADH dehydrogenase FAD-containing subunit
MAHLLLIDDDPALIPKLVRQVHLGGETVEAGAVVLSAGVLPNPLVAGLPVEKDRKGRVVVDGAMHLPGPPGGVGARGLCFDPWPRRQAVPHPGPARLARGESAGQQPPRRLSGGSSRPFVYTTLGVMGSLGHGKGFGQILGLRLRARRPPQVVQPRRGLSAPGWMRLLWARTVRAAVDPPRTQCLIRRHTRDIS